MSTQSPSHLRTIPGTGKSHKSAMIPEPLNWTPYAPRTLSDIGQQYWRAYVKALIGVNALFAFDLPALEDLCHMEALKHQARDELAGVNGLVVEYKNEEGQVTHTQPRAEFSNLKSIQAQINKLRSEFGFTPLSRGGVVIHRGSDLKPSNSLIKPKPTP